MPFTVINPKRYTFDLVDDHGVVGSISCPAEDYPAIAEDLGKQAPNLRIANLRFEGREA